MTAAGNAGDLWIFAYGSLMWRPDFPYEERLKARLFGYHRAFCIYSTHYRGTPEHPGLVLGLDRGGSCVGLCFRIAPGSAAATLAAVRARELVTSVYREIAAPVRLADARRHTAVAYAADRTHAQYAGALPLPELLRLVGQGHGVAGPNIDYVRNTHRHLVELGIRDDLLASLAMRARPADVQPPGRTRPPAP